MTRLINTGHEYTQLTEQFRMIPAVADLVSDIYSDLVTVCPPDSSLTPPLPHCFLHPVFWWNHHSYEYKDLSPRNELEVEKICALAKFLLLHHLDETRITILTGYQGQVAAIKEMMEYRCTSHGDTDKLRKIQVRTVDSYQGSENDVILLTLVRNNPGKAIGFMDLAGRRCVALSRARLAIYIVGSKDVFRHTEWGSVVDRLETRGMIGDALPLESEKGERRNVESAKELWEICDELTKQGLESGGDVSSEAKIDAENEGDADNNW